jgi:hypothetical protein
MIIVAVATAGYVTCLRSEMRTLYKKHSIKICRSGANGEEYSIQAHWLTLVNPDASYDYPFIWRRALETTGPQTDSFTDEQLKKIFSFLNPLNMEHIVVEKPVRLP